MSFLSPSALTSCDAPSGGSQPPDDPASALLSGLRPARPLRRRPASPLRFFAMADAMRLCSIADRSVAVVARNLVARTRRLSIRNASRLVIGHPRGCRSAKPIRFTLANDPSHQALPLRSDRLAARTIVQQCCPDAIDNPVHPLPKPGHAPTRSLARCTATGRPEPSQPG